MATTEEYTLIDLIQGFRLNGSREITSRTIASIQLLNETMPYIRVIYKTSKFDYVSEDLLDSLIKLGQITHFYRSSENRWINTTALFFTGQ